MAEDSLAREGPLPGEAWTSGTINSGEEEDQYLTFKVRIACRPGAGLAWCTPLVLAM
jgi:hypothetical protein